MIKFEELYVVGWEPAIRGMRNPKNSWDKSDSVYIPMQFCDEEEDFEKSLICGGVSPVIQENDHSLSMTLRNAGRDHRKYMRMLAVYVDITAPLYFWKEYDTYKVGTVTNSCSTMHTIHLKEFELDDFSCEHLDSVSLSVLKTIIDNLNFNRNAFIGKYEEIKKGDKNWWWQMIQLLPSSYNQRRTCMVNYEVLANMYHSRKNHKLDEWREFCKWMESLPYSEIITGGGCIK